MRKESPIACQSHYLLRNDATEMLLENDVNSSLIGQSPYFSVRLFSKQNRLKRGLLLVIQKVPNTSLQGTIKLRRSENYL